MRWPQIMMIILYTISLTNTLINHGKKRTDKYNFWTALAGTIVGISILKAGGFWNV